MKTYHISPNEVAFARCMNGAFAGINYSLELIGDGKGLTKKQILKAIRATIEQSNVALLSEYFRGELVKKEVLDPADDVLCTFDFSEENDEKSEVVVYTRNELDNIRLKH